MSEQDKHADWNLDTGDLIIMDACCCWNDSFYCKTPDCIGTFPPLLLMPSDIWPLLPTWLTMEPEAHRRILLALPAA